MAYQKSRYFFNGEAYVFASGASNPTYDNATLTQLANLPANTHVILNGTYSISQQITYAPGLVIDGMGESRLGGTVIKQAPGTNLAGWGAGGTTSTTTTTVIPAHQAGQSISVTLASAITQTDSSWNMQPVLIGGETFSVVGGFNGATIGPNVTLVAQKGTSGSNAPSIAAGATVQTCMPTALLVPYNWATNATNGETATSFRNVQVDCNLSQNPTSAASAVIVDGYFGSITNCQFNGAAHGLRMTDRNSLNGNMSPTGSNWRIQNNDLSGVLGSGLCSEQSVSGNFTDAFIIDNYITGAGVHGIYCDQSAGYFIERNHVYGVQYGNGMQAGKTFATHIVGNYIEPIGSTVNASEYASGITFASTPGWPTVVTDNIILLNDTAGSHLYGIAANISGSSGIFQLQISNNVVQTNGGISTTIGYLLNAPSGSPIYVAGNVGQCYGLSAGQAIVVGNNPANLIMANVREAQQAFQSIAYSATVTIDPFAGRYAQISALTGNVTVANPAGVAAKGEELQIEFLQDATGSRTVTWGTLFHTSSVISSTANSRSVASFFYNGSAWIQTSLVTGLT